MLSEQIQTFINILKQGKEQGRGVVIPAEMMTQVRANNDMMIQMMKLPDNVEIEERSIAGQTGEYYTYDKKDPEKVQNQIILYIHGGGFENGTVKSRRFCSMNLSHFSKMDCYSVEYSQWPEGMHPSGLMQCVKVYQTLVDEYGAENIYVAGESGGAVLTLTMTLYLKKHNIAMPRKLAAIGPVIDFTDNFESRTAREARDPMLYTNVGTSIRYFTEEDRKDPYASIRYGDVAGFPDTIITVGTEEVLYDDAITLHEMMNKAGVNNELKVYDGLFHAFQLFDCPESIESIKTICEFLKK